VSVTLPAPGTVLKALGAIPDPGGAPADYDAVPILIVRAGGTVRAYVNVCPHQGRPLPAVRAHVGERGPIHRLPVPWRQL